MAGKSGKNAMRLARFSRFSTKNPEKNEYKRGLWLLARKLESLKSGFMSWPLKQKEREGSGRRSEALIGRRGYFHRPDESWVSSGSSLVGSFFVMAGGYAAHYGWWEGLSV
jgi:hypothetical protein